VVASRTVEHLSCRETRKRVTAHGQTSKRAAGKSPLSED
jgi:hypothetical protein